MGKISVPKYEITDQVRAQGRAGVDLGQNVLQDPGYRTEENARTQMKSLTKALSGAPKPYTVQVDSESE